MTDKPEKSPLHIACNDGNQEEALSLITTGADVKTTTSSGLTPLHFAAANGMVYVCRALLWAGADVDSVSLSGNTPLLEMMQRESILKLKEEIGSDTLTGAALLASLSEPSDSMSEESESESTDYKVLSVKSEIGSDVDVAEGYDKEKVDSDLPRKDDIMDRIDSFVDKPKLFSRVAVIKCLLRHKANINHKNNQKQTALHIACKRCLLQSSLCLLSYKPDVTLLDIHSHSALHYACAFERLHRVVYNILAISSDCIDCITVQGKTPLIISCETGSRDSTRELLRHSPYLDTSDTDVGSALHYATHLGDAFIVAELLRAGAKVSAKGGRSGNTPLHLACRHGNRGIVSALLYHGADPNALNKDKRTPMHFAAEDGDLRVIEMLLDKGGDPLGGKVKPKPADIAKIKGNMDAYELNINDHHFLSLLLPSPRIKFIMSNKIIAVKARQIFDSRGNPTVEVDVKTEKGLFRAAVPSGASTGDYEALELRDKIPTDYMGKGVLKAVSNVNDILAPAIIGKEAELEGIDKIILALDGTKHKSKLGANAILGVSMAVCRAEAAAMDLPLYKFIAKKFGTEQISAPVPCMNVINGGSHAGNALPMQEYMIAPAGAKDFVEAMKMATETYHHLKSIIKAKYGLDATNVGAEGGFAPPLLDVEEPLRLLVAAIDKAGYTGKIKICMDVAASEFYVDGKYDLGKWADKPNIVTGEELTALYLDWTERYPIVSIEDPFDQMDIKNWA
ncbi:Enolase, partial [Aduncisulcus paluster]